MSTYQGRPCVKCGSIERYLRDNDCAPCSRARHDNSAARESAKERKQRQRRGEPNLTIQKQVKHPHRIDLTIPDGQVLVGSDAHIWPGALTTAQRAFIWFSRREEWDATILDGDVFDGARVSRHPALGWEDRPLPAEELLACQHVLEQILGRRRIWAFGNHDWRFESYIAKNAPELQGLKGAHLKDWFPDWEPCWRVRINGNVNIKHRAPGTSPQTRGRLAGTSLVTGHLHSLNVVRFSNYNGHQFSCDSGTLAACPGELFVPQFSNYTEDNAVDWASGFIVLTFRDGRLLWPEVVHVIDEVAGLISWRGEVLSV